MASDKSEIPLKNSAQRLVIALGGVTYTLVLKWNSITSLWDLDILDANENPILRGVPLVANTDLLAPYGYLNFGGQLVAWTDGDANLPPTYTNLGTLGHLFFLLIP